MLRCDVRVVAIGVTRNIDYQELRLIASTDCDVHTVDYFDQMTSDMNATMNLIRKKVTPTGTQTSKPVMM